MNEKGYSVSGLNFRPYEQNDFHAVRDFLVASVPHFAAPANWYLDRWNFVSEVARHFHDISRELWASRIGLWEDASGAIQAMANEEEGTGAVFFQFARPELAAPELLDRMFAFAEDRLCIDGRFGLRATLPAIGDAARSRGYAPADWGGEVWSRRELDRIAAAPLPEPYRFAAQGEVTPAMRVLAHARAFGWAGKLEVETLAWNAFANLNGLADWRPELDCCVLGPLGDVVSFATVWLDEANRLCILEPVGTAPEHRRRGLAEAAIALGLRRARDRGALWAGVGSDQPFYRAIGFKPVTSHPVWEYRRG